MKTATINYSKEKFIKDPERFLKDGYWKDFVEEVEPFEEKNRFEKPRQKTGDELFADEFKEVQSKNPKDITPRRIEA